jgi:hypothetical protein
MGACSRNPDPLPPERGGDSPVGDGTGGTLISSPLPPHVMGGEGGRAKRPIPDPRGAGGREKWVMLRSSAALRMPKE